MFLHFQVSANQVHVFIRRGERQVSHMTQIIQKFSTAMIGIFIISNRCNRRTEWKTNWRHFTSLNTRASHVDSWAVYRTTVLMDCREAGIKIYCLESAQRGYCAFMFVQLSASILNRKKENTHPNTHTNTRTYNSYSENHDSILMLVFLHVTPSNPRPYRC